MVSSTVTQVDPRRRGLLKGSLIGMGSLLVGGGYLALRHIQNDAASMVLQTGWLPGTPQIGEIVAKRKGFFTQEGIDFRIAGGGPSIDGVAVVASGSANAGQISSSPSIMLAVSQNIPIQCFAAALQKHPYGYFSLPRNPVRTIQDMVGKRVGVQSTAQVLLKAMLAKANLPMDSVQVIPVGADLSPLLTGQVDVISGWSTDTTALRVLGPDRVDLNLWDTGVHLYALPYYAAVHTLNNEFDSIVRFLRATTRGWVYARDHMDEAAELLVQEYPSLNRNDERVAIETMMSFAFGDLTRQSGWGTMDPALWREQIAMYAGLGQFTNHVPTVDEVMTLKVLNATQPYRMRIDQSAD
jgi:NitT/TauT family transport system substrate-binding protein